jgi:hypothetical protein
MNVGQEMKQTNKQLLIAVLAAAVLAVPTAQASERESLEQLRATTMNLIELLVQEGVLSKSKADNLIRDAESARLAGIEKDDLEKAADRVAPESESGQKVVRVQYVPEHVKKEMRDEIKKEVMAKLNYKAGERLGLPDWIDRIQWEGDLRLRYELDSFANGNAPAVAFQSSETRNADIDNSENERNRFRVRARLGAKLKINDWLDGGIRMTTGSNTDPVSPNQTMETSSSKYMFALDRAYLRARPVDWASVSGGRIDNPFFSTDLVWDPDLAFDGLAAVFNPKFNDNWSAFGTLGAFSIDEQESSDTNKARDKWMFGAQAGLQWKGESRSTVRLGAALYDFRNVEGEANPIGSGEYDNTILGFRSKGNNTFSIDAANGNFCGFGGPCGLASEFRELNLTGQIDLATFDPVHVILTADYVRNIGFDKQEIARRTGQPVGTYKEETDGYQVSLNIGMPKVVQRNDWQVFGAYKRIEADAVLDAFTDSDFHLGGTDTKGWVLGASYGVDKNAWLTARWFSADEITGLPLATDVLLLDFNARF